MIPRDQHIANLKSSENRIDYLKKHSGLPGKRGNLELMDIAVELGDEVFFKQCLEYNENMAPTNTPGEFVATCGAAGFGKLISEGKSGYWSMLKKLASDPRWRVREGVAFALQRVGQNNFDTLIEHLSEWKSGNPYEKRAIVAGLCEPVLLKEKFHAEIVLDILHEIIQSIKDIQDRKGEPFRVLRKGLGYGFSVATVAHPEKGKALFEELMKEDPDKDIQWILKENLKKNRLMRMDKEWTEKMKNILG